MQEREKIIANYIEGYNSFDLVKMMRDFAPDIVFENIHQGETNMRIVGIEDFKEQAEEALQYFSARKQTIVKCEHYEKKTTIAIHYVGVLAMDFPNGIKKGETIELTGQSVFEFENQKIIRLTDVS